MKTLQEFTHSLREEATLNELLPRQLRESNVTFVQLLEEYYAFLSQEKNPSYVIDRIIAEHDLDRVFDPAYLTKIKYEIAKSIPTNRYLQKAFLLKRIIEIYNLRGNHESIKFFFRVFFGDDVQIYNPWERVFKPSMGKWTQRHRLVVVLYYGNEEDFRLNTIRQVDPSGIANAQADVLEVRSYSHRGLTYFVIDLQEDSILGTFTQENFIRSIDNKIFGRVVRTLSDIRIINGGYNYSIGDTIEIQGADSPFVANISKVGPLGEILDFTIKTRGISSSIKYFDRQFSGMPQPSDVPLLSMIYVEGDLIETENTGRLLLRGLGTPTFEYTILPNRALSERLEVDKVNEHKVYPFPARVAISGINTSRGIEVLTIESLDKNRLLTYDYSPITQEEWDTKYTQLNPQNSVPLQFYSKTKNAVNAAELQFEFSPYYVTEGEYETEHGTPSGYSVLQDSFYYQIFSYEIDSSVQVVEWRNQLDDFIHPAGFKGFGLLNLKTEESLADELLHAIDVNPAFEFPKVVSNDSMQIDTMINMSTQSYNGAIEDIGPYFAEDYAEGASFAMDLIYTIDETPLKLVYTDDNITYDLIYSIGSRVGMSKTSQGVNSEGIVEIDFRE